jgi:hypothetical protein
VAGGWGSGIEAGAGVSCGGWMNSGCGGGGRADRKVEADDPARVVPSRYHVSSRSRRPPPAPCLIFSSACLCALNERRAIRLLRSERKAVAGSWSEFKLHAQLEEPALGRVFQFIRNDIIHQIFEQSPISQFALPSQKHSDRRGFFFPFGSLISPHLG